MKTTGLFLFLIVFLIIFGYFFQEPLLVRWHFLNAQFFPCKDPITYSIGVFDTQFGISKENFLKALKEAEALWEKPLGKELFMYEPDGYLKVNLVYDYRQDATQTLKKLGLEVDQSKASYENLKQKYESMVSQFERDEQAFDSRIAAFETRKKTYENDVARANRQKNLSKAEYGRITAEGESLEREVVTLNQTQASLAKEVDDLNTVARALNDMARGLNLNVTRYNEVGKSFKGEFTQGVYESHGEGEGITIFQYDSYGKLVRVLAHELGHALSLEHLENPKAIMYRLNEGSNEILTSDDLVALKEHCSI